LSAALFHAHGSFEKPKSPRGGLLVAVVAVYLAVFSAGRELAVGAESPRPVAATNALRPFQIISTNRPPLPPTQFNPDVGVPPVSTNLAVPKTFLQLNWRTNSEKPTQPPSVFNPDPGAMLKTPSTNAPFFTNEFARPPAFQGEPVPEAFTLPRTNVRSQKLEFVEPPITNRADTPFPKDLALPRERTRANQYIEPTWENPNYPVSRQGYPNLPFTRPETNRWRLGFVPWRRYTSGAIETPYETPKPILWHPYQQSILKGDVPIIGQDIFLNLTAGSETTFEARRVPTPSGVSSARPDSAEFFGKSEQLFVQNNFSFTVDLFEGETVFKPVHWALRLQPVYNVNYTDTRETTVISANPAQGTDRTDDFIALQEGFAEFHLSDLSENYDFIATRVGNQPFNSDFRGFIFNDINLGARIFGNVDNNRWQYNFLVLDLLEKDTHSELNTFDRRDQRVIIANMYRQDLLWRGYTAQFSFHANLDEGGTHYDGNGNLARPAPLGTVEPHGVRAYYLGWTGDGHIGRLNLSHAFYQVFGHDDLNGLAGRPVDINAQMAALELSYDRDWIRWKASFFYASGDGNAEDGKGRGFDTILDNPNFTGGPFSWYVRQGINLAGTAVGLKQRNSLVPNLRTSKTEGQANFVNPGIVLVGAGTEIELTPKLRSFVNVNYIHFVETDPIKTALLTDKVRRELGLDLSVGFQYRPLLTDNIILSAGFGALIPGRGFRDIYQTNPDPVQGYGSQRAGRVDDFLYNGVVALTFTF
jgi:hypothetical protein